MIKLIKKIRLKMVVLFYSFKLGLKYKELKGVWIALERMLEIERNKNK